MTTTTQRPARREFIPKLRKSIVDNCPGADDPAYEAIDRWSAGETEPESLFERAVWEICDEIARRLDEFDEEPGGKS